MQEKRHYRRGVSCAAAFPILAYSLVFSAELVSESGAQQPKRKGFTMSERQTCAQSSQQGTGSHDIRTGLESNCTNFTPVKCTR